MLNKPSSCSGCPLYSGIYGSSKGFSVSDGTGKNGVLIVGEALGQSEEIEGIPLVGKSGHYLFNSLSRIGVERDDFTLFNVIACRPPDNKLVGTPYEKEAISHCGPNLDGVIEKARRIASENGRTFTIITLGRTAFKRIMGLDDRSPMMRKDFQCYPHWNPRYQAWVIATDHPSYLMRGKHNLLPVLQFAFKRALEISEFGLIIPPTNYLLDPSPHLFKGWIRDYLLNLERGEEIYLSYDIETLMKQGNNEEDVAREDDDDYTILRCSFSYRDNEAVSVPWNSMYFPLLEELFAIDAPMVGWNCPAPDQLILTYDLRWVRADSIQEGDKLIGVDEEINKGRKFRRFKQVNVTHASANVGHLFKIAFSDGSEVKVTGEHKWLLTQRGRKVRHGGSAWIETKDLVVGQFINKFFDPWQEDVSKDAGYLAGFFDGEGFLSYNGTALTVGASQNQGLVLDKVINLLRTRDFITQLKFVQSREKDYGLCNFTIKKGFVGTAKFLGSIRPVRLLNKFFPSMLGATWSLHTEPVTITNITDLGQQPIVRLSTDEHTYILEGFIAHNCDNYDLPRVSAQVKVNGDQIDAMHAWHVVNSSMPKGLGFVSPFYNPTLKMWKHLSSDQPALYNAIDAVAALNCWLGIKRDLISNDQWHVFERHTIMAGRVLDYMSSVGVLLDQPMRNEAEIKLQSIMDRIESSINDVIPVEARTLKVYKKTPSDTNGMVQTRGKVKVSKCPRCGMEGVKADHFKSIGKKRLTTCIQCKQPLKKHCDLDEPGVDHGDCNLFHHEFKGEVENKCVGFKGEKVEIETNLWAFIEPFKISNQSLQRYQKVKGHQFIVDHKSKKITYDEKAITRLMKRYKSDALYPLILEFRKHQKLLSTYIGVTQYSEIEVGDDYILADGEKKI